MPILSRTLLSAILLALYFYSAAQQFGGNPPSIKWRQINTDTVRVIFPRGLETVAREIASISHQMGSAQSTLGNRLRKINVVLQNQTTISNGYVGLGPFRSEFYMTPQQNSFELGSLPWYRQLALHEFRHVQQYNNFRKGLSAVFYGLAGELGLSFANNTALPSYFWEGDAVYQETISSNQGRGRMPFFFNGYRSIWAAKKDYSWMKLRSGSLRDFVPNHYQMGYLITAYGREKYGQDIWGKITDDAVRFRRLFYPFQAAVKRHTGKDYQDFREEALAFFKQQVDATGDSINSWAAKQKHFVGDQEFPQWIDDEHVVYIRSSYKRIPQFVTLNVETGEEKMIRTRDISIDNYFSYRNGQIVYSAYDPDLRWGFRDFGEIRMLDVRSGAQRTVTQKTKYFAPDISADGTRIVAVQILPAGTNALHIIDATTGRLIKDVPNPDSLYYTYPKFYGNNQLVSAIRNHNGEMALGLVSAENGSVEWLTSFSMNVIGFPHVSGDTISFTASFGEQDKLFMVIDKKIYQCIPAADNKITGSYQLNQYGRSIVWVDFTSAGYRMRTQTLIRATLKPVELPASSLPAYGVTALQKPVTASRDGVLSEYPVKRYSKGFRLFNFHSWLPTSVTESEATLTFISENILNTLVTDAYLTYNWNEKSKKVGFVSAYGALFPWIRTGLAYTHDFPLGYVNDSVVLSDQWEAKLGFLVPFNLSEGRTFSNLRIGTDYVYAKTQITGEFKDRYSIDGYGYLHSYLTFSAQSQQARQNIYPRWATALFLNQYTGVTNEERNKFIANGYFYLPGAHLNHNLVFNAAWQKIDSAGLINYSNIFPFSRGYNATFLPDNYQEYKQWKLGVNYHFPLVYPDWGFGNIVYFQRIRANAFYDFTRRNGFDIRTKAEATYDYRSYGAEIFFDTKWWNQQPVSFGVRYSRLLDAGVQGLDPNQFEFVLPVNLISR